jgi:hypothetical protein
VRFRVISWIRITLELLSVLQLSTINIDDVSETSNG